jgi:hypothetical protein
LDPRQGRGHVDLRLQQGDPTGGQKKADQPPTTGRVHVEEALALQRVFFQKPSEVDGLTLEIFSEMDRGAVHGRSVVFSSDRLDCSGCARNDRMTLDTTIKLPNKIL